MQRAASVASQLTAVNRSVGATSRNLSALLHTLSAVDEAAAALLKVEGFSTLLFCIVTIITIAVVFLASDCTGTRQQDRGAVAGSESSSCQLCPV